MNLKRQVRRLLLLEGLSNFHLAGTAWVLLLTLRGFTPVQIGLAEGVFHLASLCFELPSGMLADLMGRKGTLFASRCASLLSALAMLRSSGGAGLCLAMVLNALSYNLSSGTREAMTYDSLLEAGQEVHYLRLSALQNICWRGAGAAALLCAGVTAALGWQRAYGLDMLVDGLALAVVLGLAEPAVGAPEVRPRLRALPQGFAQCGRDAVEFLRAVPAAGRLMLVNALVGAAATLLGFFLQDGLVRAEAGTAALGPLLLAAALGGVAGSRLAPRLEGMYLGVDPGGLSLRRAGQSLLLGGQSHRTGVQKNRPYRALASSAHKLFPQAKIWQKWSAQDCITLDSVPYIGRFSRRNRDWYVATGFGKWGMTLSMVSAHLLTDLICKRTSPYEALYSPLRFPALSAVPRLAGHMTRSAAGLIKGLAPGVMRCPHMGCKLSWNAAEATWDCPCHGSRFDSSGKLMTGPSQTSCRCHKLIP